MLLKEKFCDTGAESRQQKESLCCLSSNLDVAKKKGCTLSCCDKENDNDNLFLSFFTIKKSEKNACQGPPPGTGKNVDKDCLQVSRQDVYQG